VVLLYNMHKEMAKNTENQVLQSAGQNAIINGNGGMFMRGFPIFATEYGVSSLVLKEIPYKKQAYVRIRDVQKSFFAEHMAECVSFCRMCGAESVFAAGQETLEEYPLYMAVIEMCGTARVDPEKVKHLFPVTKETVSRWRDVYNEKMRDVDNTATLESRDEKRIVESSGAYFVHENGKLLGIGWLEENKILAVAAVEKGAGETVMHTLMTLISEDRVMLEVASTNERAIRLYEKLGFVKTAEITRWYDVTAVKWEEEA